MGLTGKGDKMREITLIASAVMLLMTLEYFVLLFRIESANDRLKRIEFMLEDVNNDRARG